MLENKKLGYVASEQNMKRSEEGIKRQVRKRVLRVNGAAAALTADSEDAVIVGRWDDIEVPHAHIAAPNSNLEAHLV
jgi:aspartate 1-decarboxylase